MDTLTIAVVATASAAVLAVLQLVYQRYRDARMRHWRAAERGGDLESRIRLTEHELGRIRDELQSSSGRLKSEDFDAKLEELDHADRDELTVESLVNRIRAMGFEHVFIDGENVRLAVADSTTEVRARFELSIDVLGGINIISMSGYISREELDTASLLRLLELNSENKVGTIGLQWLDGRSEFRVWVDQYLTVGGRLPSVDTLRFVFLAMMAVHHELQTVISVYQAAEIEA